MAARDESLGASTLQRARARSARASPRRAVRRSGLLRAHRARGRDVRWIPPGGTSPLGMLGHVNAALELAQQVSRGEMPAPARVVLPVGSGGTAAGLALGLAIAGMDTMVVGARVAPRIAAGRARVLALARRARSYFERLTRRAHSARRSVASRDRPQCLRGRVRARAAGGGGAPRCCCARRRGSSSTAPIVRRRSPPPLARALAQYGAARCSG